MTKVKHAQSSDYASVKVPYILDYQKSGEICFLKMFGLYVYRRVGSLHSLLGLTYRDAYK